MDSTKHHRLQSPLVVYSGGPHSHIGFLPSGTSLRYVDSFDEGFDRFLVYVNVERCPVTLRETIPSDLIDPLSAIPSDQTLPEHPMITLDELYSLLRSLGVSKSNLENLCEAYEVK